MASTTYIPVLTWLQALVTGVANGPSANLTVTVNITAGWEAQVPVKIQFGSQVSNDPLVQVYPSSDGGATYDSIPMAGFGLTNNASSANQGSIRLPTGQYALRISTSGGNTVTVFVNTIQVLTAYQGS